MKTIKENWILIAFITSLIITWTTFGLRLTAVELRAQENQSTLEIVRDMQVDIAVMKKDIEFIRMQVK